MSPHRLVALWVGTLAVAACSGGDDRALSTAPTTTSAATATEQSPPAGSAPAAVDVPEIVDFAAPAVGGGEVDVAALADRPLALWFWAPT